MSELILETNSLPLGWIKTKLTNIAEIKSGGTPSTVKKEYWDGKIPWINSSKLKDTLITEPSKYITSEGLSNSSAKLFPKDTVVIALTGATTSKVGYLTFSSTTNQSITGILPNSFYHPKFLFYSLIFERNQILSNKIGSAQHHINQGIVERIKIAFCPLNEQKRIVEKIEELFSLIDSIIMILEKIKIQQNEFRQSILKSAFEGKFTEKWRQKNKPILQKEEIELWKNQRQTQYDEGCKLSTSPNKPKLPEFKIIDDNNIPQSWISMTIESVASFVIDCPHSTPKFVDNGEYCIDTTCIEQSKIRWDDVRKIPSKQFQERITRMPILENDIIFSREGTVGTAVMIPKDVKLCLGQRVMMFRFPDFLNPKFCELFLQSSNFRQQYLPLIGGSVAQHLNVGDIRKFKILIPTIKEQKEITFNLELVLSLIKNTENITNSMLIQLDRLRSTMLKQAFEGKLVPQDPNDEPAEILLQKIKQEKQLIQKQKTSRSTKNVK